MLFQFENLDGKSLVIDYPLSTAVIAEHQQKDTTLVRHIKRHPEYFTKRVDGHDVILLNNKIYIPKSLRTEILKWYHTTLQNPGIIRTEKSIRSHLTWPGMRTDMEEHFKKCHVCQL
jgi:Integrase zinc binding domain